ncbi:MAG: RNA polymerase sigma factor [bacterium]|nr:MAG: RNA polymerase sigma factor [bacterium]
MNTEIRCASDEELSGIIAESASEEACTELFRRYSKRIYLWCYNYTHDEEEAVDLTQEIFIKIFRNIAKFSGLSMFSTWAYRVTSNHCLSELAKKREQWRRRLLSVDADGVPDPVDNQFDRELGLVGDLERILASAREFIPGDELEVFILHYRDGMTVNEITKILGCENITGARTLLQNARRKFKRLIEHEGFGNG